jgi:signal transduction histidine kinase
MGVSIFTLVVVGAFFYMFVGDYVLDRQQADLEEQAAQVAEQVGTLSETMPGIMSRGVVLSTLLRSDLRRGQSGTGIVVFKDSAVLARAGVLPVSQQNVERLYREGRRVGDAEPGATLLRSVENASGAKIDVLVAAAPVALSSDAQGLVVVTLATSDAFAVRGSLLRILGLAGVVAVLLAAGAGVLLGSWLGRPLRRLSLVARAMGRGSFDTPLVGSYPREVGELAGSLEFMRREVSRSEESLRAFVGSAAHELRTPLMSIEGFSQALLDGTAATEEERQRSAAAIYRETTRLHRLVDALLMLSRYDSREFQPTNAKVSLKALASEEVDRLVQTGAASPGRVTVSFASEVWLVTDADMVRQVIANLLRNAVQYGGEDPIEIAGWETGEDAVLQVTNGGLPIAPDERARLFDRFFRGRAAAGSEGFGLGLVLAREICTVLGGSIELTATGPTTVFRVTLPLRPVASFGSG